MIPKVAYLVHRECITLEVLTTLCWTPSHHSWKVAYFSCDILRDCVAFAKQSDPSVI